METLSYSRNEPSRKSLTNRKTFGDMKFTFVITGRRFRSRKPHFKIDYVKRTPITNSLYAGGWQLARRVCTSYGPHALRSKFGNVGLGNTFPRSTTHSLVLRTYKRATPETTREVHGGFRFVQHVLLGTCCQPYPID